MATKHFNGTRQNQFMVALAGYVSMTTIILIIGQLGTSSAAAIVEHIYNGTSGEFRSPGYPLQYGKNEDVVYTVLGQPGSIIKLSWKEFEVVDFAPQCSDAYFKIVLGYVFSAPKHYFFSPDYTICLEKKKQNDFGWKTQETHLKRS